MKTAGIDRFSEQIRTQESALITEIAKELKRTASQLYFAQQRALGAGITTNVDSSLRTAEVDITICGCGVTFEGGTIKV
jgi:hypothetical protein